MKARTIKMADEQKVILTSYGSVVAEIEFSIREQNISVAFYSRNGAVQAPVLVGVDTKMLGHSEDDE